MVTSTDRQEEKDGLEGPLPVPTPLLVTTWLKPHEEEPWEDLCPGMEESVRRLRLQDLLSEDSEGDDEDAKEISECFMVNPVHEAFLTGKAVRSEINLKDLAPDERKLFDAAMAKEWDSWMKFSAVEVLSPEQVEQLPGDTPVFGTRWVHVDKNKKVRMMAGGIKGKTKKTSEQIAKEYPLVAKSRIVVQGNQEEETGIRSHSPTASLLGFNLVCSVAVMKRWEVRAYDASTAYLQAKGIFGFETTSTSTSWSISARPPES